MPLPQPIPDPRSHRANVEAARRLPSSLELKRAIEQAQDLPAQYKAWEQTLQQAEELRQAQAAIARQEKAAARTSSQVGTLRRPSEGAPNRRAQLKPRVQPKKRPDLEPQRKDSPSNVAEAIARRHVKSRREAAIAFLQATEMTLEQEHLVAIEERLHAGSPPALFHAALSTRLLLEGIADHCFQGRAEQIVDRFGRSHDVKKINVGNRIAAYVDIRLKTILSDEEHRLFVANLDTVNRWCGRGPHRIYNPREAEEFFLRLLDVLNVIARAYAARSI